MLRIFQVSSATQWAKNKLMILHNKAETKPIPEWILKEIELIHDGIETLEHKSEDNNNSIFESLSPAGRFKKISARFDINCAAKCCSFTVAVCGRKIPDQCRFLSPNHSFCSIFQAELHTNSRGMYKRCQECLKAEVK